MLSQLDFDITLMAPQPKIQDALSWSNAIGRTGLHQAAYYGQYKMIKYLVPIFNINLIDIDQQDMHSTTQNPFLIFLDENAMILAC